MLKWSTIKSLQPPILVVSWVFSHRHEFLKCLQKKKSDNKTITKRYRQGSVLQDLRKGYSSGESDYGQCPIHSLFFWNSTSHSHLSPTIPLSGWSGLERWSEALFPDHGKPVRNGHVQPRPWGNESKDQGFIETVRKPDLLFSAGNSSWKGDLQVQAAKDHSRHEAIADTESQQRQTDSNPDTFKAGCSV